MNDQHVLIEHSLKAKYINSTKRQRQAHRNQYQSNVDNVNDITNHRRNDQIITIFKTELENIFCYFNPLVHDLEVKDIQPYGSRISGVYSYNSDIDINISYCSPNSVWDVIKILVYKVRQSKLFYRVVPILYARIPIIKCVHKETGVRCDMSFNNIIAVYNSHLLKYIISIDNRIKPVLLKLKTWAKQIGIICTNGFSSYSFYWLGIFCMQIMKILPSIYELQKSVPEFKIGYWNYAITYNHSNLINQKQNNLSENDLLNAIYTYYASFDFESWVICPYIGFSLMKNSFIDVEYLPKELQKYTEFHKEHIEHCESLFLGVLKCSVYLQDPFQLNSNITARVTPKVFHDFITACKEMRNRQTSEYIQK